MKTNLIRYFFNRFRNLILYGLIGCFTSGLDFLVFTLLVQCISLHYIIANCISVLVGISTSFYLNRKYNFKVTDKTIRRFLTFLAVGLCGLMLSNLILWVGITQLHYNEILTKLASIVLVVFFQFLFNKFITFKK
jgi:putative flippase GtrA